MVFNVSNFFNSLDFIMLNASDNVSEGLKFGFIFFLSAMFVGIGLNYAFRFLKH